MFGALVVYLIVFCGLWLYILSYSGGSGRIFSRILGALIIYIYIYIFIFVCRQFTK